MATVSLPIGGRLYDVTCRPGGEESLRRLAVMVDDKVGRAAQSAGQTDEVRRLLFAALLLADELAEARAGGPAPRAPPIDLSTIAVAVERLAERVEKLADGLDEHTEAA